MKVLICDNSNQNFWKIPNSLIDKLKSVCGQHELVIVTSIKSALQEFKSADYIITYPFPSSLLKRCENLKGILFLTTQVPEAFQNKTQIQVENMGGLNARSVAEHGLFLFMKAMRGEVGMTSLKERSYLIAQNPKSLQIGIIGYGNISKNLLDILAPLTGRLSVLTRQSSLPLAFDSYNYDRKNEFLSKMDTIFMTVSLNQETKEIFKEENFFSHLKDSVTLINLSRGELIIDSELINFLKKNQKARYLTDVTFPEDYPEEGELNKLDQVFITPHIGGRRDDIWELYCSKIILTMKKWLGEYD